MNPPFKLLSLLTTLCAMVFSCHLALAKPAKPNIKVIAVDSSLPLYQTNAPDAPVIKTIEGSSLKLPLQVYDHSDNGMLLIQINKTKYWIDEVNVKTDQKANEEGGVSIQCNKTSGHTIGVRGMGGGCR